MYVRMWSFNCEYHRIELPYCLFSLYNAIGGAVTSNGLTVLNQVLKEDCLILRVIEATLV
jgi:hypothetical protein